MNGIEFDLAVLINTSIAVMIGGLIGALIAGQIGRRLLRHSAAKVKQLAADAKVRAANAETYFETTVRFLEHFAKELLTELGVLEDIGFQWVRDPNGRLLNATIKLKVTSPRSGQAADGAGRRIAS